MLRIFLEVRFFRIYFRMLKIFGNTRISLFRAIYYLVPRSHSVTGNVRSGKVRQYTIFHWPLKKDCGNAIYAPIGLFCGARNEGLVFASSCAVLCGGKFCFFRRRKSFTVMENHFKNLRRLCKWYRHSKNVLRSLIRGTRVNSG